MNEAQMDSIIAEHTQVETPAVQDTAIIEQEATQEVQADETEGEELEAQEGEQEEREPFPKKAVNKIDRLSKDKARLQGQNKELRAQMERMAAEYQRFQTKDTAPNEDDYDNYGDLVQARAEHSIENKFTQMERAKLEAAYEQKHQEYTQNRQQEIATQAEEISTIIPDYLATNKQFAPIVDALPEHVVEKMMEAENAPLAFYTLAKEGRLEALSRMTPVQVEIAIASATERGQQFLKPKAISNAPKPMTGVKGTGLQSKPLNQMSGDELMKWMKS